MNETSEGRELDAHAMRTRFDVAGPEETPAGYLDRIRTPWGRSDDRPTYIGPGVWSVSTPSHGGMKLDRKRNAKVAPYWRRDGGWYEEDCEWAIVALTFPELFEARMVASAHATAAHYYPEGYAAHVQAHHVVREVPKA